ncbi:MAG: hypothetical protein K2O35_03635 [Clostridia bacterium]|nr:hypothetical protein [Clostridia bacterium]
MWWLYLIFALILLLFACIIFVIAYGVKFVLRVDADNLSVCAQCFILDRIEIFCIKIFVCQGLFYYQINKNDLKILKRGDNEGAKTQNKRKKAKKLKIGAYLSNLLSKSPNLTVRSLSVNYGTSFEEIKDRALFDGYTTLIANTFMAIGSEKLKVQEFGLQNVSDISTFNGVDIECVMGLSLFKIAAYAIYAMIIKNKYKVAV